MVSKVKVQGLMSAVATGALLAAMAASAVAQQSGADTAPASAPPPVTQTAASTDAPLGAAAPDPLTPTRAEDSVLLAPGAPVNADVKPATSMGASETTQAAPAQKEAHPIVTEARRILAVATGASAGEKADRAALAAFYETGSAPIWTADSGLTPRASAVIAELQRADEYGLEPSAFATPSPAAGASAAELGEAEVKIGLAVLKYARHARGGRVDPRSLSQAIDREPRLYDPRSVIDAIAVTDTADGYLAKLNPQHPGFQKLKTVLKAARAGEHVTAGADKGGKGAARSNSDIVQRILVNMERWRWMPDDLGEFYVWDNVPEQLTRAMHDGKAVLTERIVVGKPTTQTPEFSAPMRFVIFHPTWGVPEGIKTNELAPMLRRASGNGGFWLFGDNDGASRALKRHELVVSHNGRPVNPDSVNWSSVDIRQFQFTQPASGRNVLGIVKFRFPNKYDVYMHDTPERHLFNNGTRAFSHGCMRVQNPMRLAEVILAYDKGWSAEKVNGYLRGGTAEITLEKKVPVHITYFTASVDDEGKLRLHGDVYGRDARVASALAGKHVDMAPIAVSSVDREEGSAPPTGGSKKRERAAARGQQGRVKSAKQEGLSFNPFSGLSAN